VKVETMSTGDTSLADPSPQKELSRRALRIWQRLLQLSRRQPRRLRLCESLPLGDRRFVAVIEFEESRFLLGGTSASLVLLARLEDRSHPTLPPGFNGFPATSDEENRQ
jgi:flagellar biogenesis protein FliO